MVKKNIGVVSGEQEQAKQEKDLLKKIKPSLERFVIDKQVDKAAYTSMEEAEKTAKMLKKVDKEQTDLQASKLAMRAFVDLKLWQLKPPAIDMAWTTGMTQDGRKISEGEARQEFLTDVSGFSSYLVREFYNMEEQIKKGKYPNPMSEANLEFFWDKFCKDILILIKINSNIIKSGNKGLIVPNDSN